MRVVGCYTVVLYLKNQKIKKKITFHCSCVGSRLLRCFLQRSIPYILNPTHALGRLIKYCIGCTWKVPSGHMYLRFFCPSRHPRQTLLFFIQFYSKNIYLVFVFFKLYYYIALVLWVQNPDTTRHPALRLRIGRYCFLLLPPSSSFFLLLPSSSFFLLLPSSHSTT